MRLVCGLVTTVALAGCAIQIPYFEKLSYDEVCGRATKQCVAPGGVKFDWVQPGKDYNGDPASILGRKYVNVHSTLPCVVTKPIADNIETFGQNKLTGTLTSDSTASFKSEVNADILELIEKYTGGLPKDLNADLEAQVNNATNTKLSRKVALEYKRLALKDSFKETTNFSNCLASLKSGERIATGISLITVSGDWSKNTLSDILTKLEATASYKNLTADAIADYKTKKNILLNGTFEPVTYFFAVTFVPEI